MTVPHRTDEFQKMLGKAQVSPGSREQRSGMQCHQMRVSRFPGAAEPEMISGCRPTVLPLTRCHRYPQ